MEVPDIVIEGGWRSLKYMVQKGLCNTLERTRGVSSQQTAPKNCCPSLPKKKEEKGEKGEKKPALVKERARTPLVLKMVMSFKELSNGEREKQKRLRLLSVAG